MLPRTPLNSGRRTPLKIIEMNEDSDEEFRGFPQTKNPEAKKLSRQRDRVLSKVKRIQAAVENPENTLNHPHLKVYSSNLESAYQEYCKLDDQLASFEEEDQLNEDYSFFEDLYFELAAKIEALMMNIKSEPGAQSSMQNMQSILIQQQPLKAPIPTFDGRYENWPKFKAMFLDIMSRSSDSDAVKLYHLDKALIGNAAGILDAKTINENNYQNAWDILNERYENPRVIIDTHIRSLLSLRKMTAETYRELRQLVDDCIRHVESLRFMKQELSGVSELFVVYLLAAALDKNTRKQWEATIQRGQLPNYADTISFLKKQCNILENCETASTTRIQPTVKPILNTSPRIVGMKSFATTNDLNAPAALCDVCKLPHKNFQCDILKNMTVTERVEKVRSLGMCFNCLRVGHCMRNCPSDGKCLKCGRRHHTLLHDDVASREKQSNYKSYPGRSVSNPAAATLSDDEPIIPEPRVANTIASTCSIRINPRKNVCLLTALVNIIDKHNKPHPCRVLLDCGSQINLISKDIVDKIGAEISPVNIQISGVNNKSSRSIGKASIEVHSRCSDYHTTLECYVTPSVTGIIPNVKFDVSSWNIPACFQLADPEFNRPNTIDMLIGNGHFFNILKSGEFKLEEHLPSLRDTQLGWVVTGEYVEQPKYSSYPLYSHPVTVEQVYDAIKEFWKIEEVSTKSALSSEEEECEQHFASTFRRDPFGRFIVQLPLKEKINQLSDCRSLALKRFYLLEQRLSRNINLREQYVAFMKEYQQLNHLKPINELKDHPSLQKFYLPHHAVLRPDSSSTKCRVVFDASAKPPGNAMSLNDVLKVGGTIQPDLISLVLRFRNHRVAFTADISKMYRQIQVEPNQTSLQRIFWRDNPGDPLRVYELSTVTYGTASAPFLATRCLVQLAREGRSRFPLGASTIEEEFYMDDMLSGDNSLQEALERQRQVKELLASGQFPIHKWCSNSHVFLQHIPIEEREQSKSLEIQGANPIIKVLGIVWNSETDEFLFVPKPMIPTSSSDPITKRKILSTIARLFDPLGFLSPFIVRLKLLMQHLWRSKHAWDEAVDEEVQYSWQQIQKALTELSNIKIPRRVTCDGAVFFEIHGFADASQNAYGACLYLRSVLADGTARLYLLCSKSKVAPLKEMTIPRLELCAALLLSRLITSVLPAMKMSLKQVVLWTDSQIVLAWLKKSPEKLQPFVRSRVVTIREETSNFRWQYVRTHENPADIVSRGQMPAELRKNKLWWHGPPFLTTDEYEHSIPEDIVEEELPEMKLCQAVLVTRQSKEPDVFLKYSFFRKLQRIVALLLRFSKNCKEKTLIKREFNPIPTITEMRNSLETIIRVIQHNAYEEEIALVKSGQPCRTIRSLNPIWVDGILRVGGRLEHSQLSFGAKHPMIMPGQHHVTTLLIRQLHEEHLHLGSSGLISVLRRRFWVTNAATTVKRVIRSCVRCFKVRPSQTSQLMGMLPAFRVNPAPPFSVTGIDYAGPFLIKHGLRKNIMLKAYLSVFVCTVTRAVHLEVVSDLSTDAFIAALQRFVSRRGLPQKIYSDNGTNFRGAHHELNELYRLFLKEQTQHQISYFCQAKGIEWHFIPPDAPEFGGIWEAAVKSAKTHLRRIIGTAKLNFEELSTVFTKIEAVLNSRPMFVTSSDPNSAEVITPAHYLVGRPLTAVPEPSYENVQSNRLDRWEYLRKLRDHFWRSWKHDYLQSLQLRKKNQKLMANLKPGMVVLVQNKNLPPLQWKMGVIEKTFPGNDNLVRAVDVRCDNTIFRRPVTKLSVLPIEDTSLK